MSISARIRQTRRSLGLSQRVVAQRAQVSLATLQNLEMGKGNPELKTLESILGVLHLNLQVQPMEVDWESFTFLGVPLMSTESFSIKPHRLALLEALQKISSLRSRLKPESREMTAVVSFCVALADHFPSVWQKADPALQSFIQKHRTQARIKLRRIALQTLSEYL